MLSEEQFLLKLLPRLPQGQATIPVGDDCAAIKRTETQLTLLAVDQVVEGVHYHGESDANATEPQLVGRKLLARNLSDIAAMGGQAEYALLTIAVPSQFNDDWLDAFTNGLLALAAEWGVAIVGGDVTASKHPVFSLTVVGQVASDRVARRDAAMAGDLVVVTGEFGGSYESGHHLTFTPRLREAQWLVEQGVRCLIDVSDGLICDLARLCQSSGTSAVVDESQIPCRALDGSPVSLAKACGDGEDHELIAAIPQSTWSRLRDNWPFATPLNSIGHFTAPEKSPAVSFAYGHQPHHAGYQHFAVLDQSTSQ